MRGTQKEPKQIDFRTLLNAYSKEFGDIIKFSITHSDSLFKLLPSSCIILYFMCYQKNKIVYSSELPDFLHVLIVCLVASDIL